MNDVFGAVWEGTEPFFLEYLSQEGLMTAEDIRQDCRPGSQAARFTAPCKAFFWGLRMSQNDKMASLSVDPPQGRKEREREREKQERKRERERTFKISASPTQRSILESQYSTPNPVPGQN